MHLASQTEIENSRMLRAHQKFLFIAKKIRTPLAGGEFYPRPLQFIEDK
jgi:hypothetical protein